MLDDYFWEITSGWMPYSARYWVRQWIHISVSLRRLLEFFNCRARRRHWQWHVLAGFCFLRYTSSCVLRRGESTGAGLKPVAIPQEQSL